MTKDTTIKIFTPTDYTSEFDPEAYLQYYYSSKALDDGTRLSLFALPMYAHLIASRLPKEKRVSLIDIGAGPTVYSALCFRDVVERVYLTDYVDKSLEILDDWLDEKTAFNWEKTIRVIARTEGTQIACEKDVDAIEAKARTTVMKGGIYKADVHTDGILLLRNDDKPPVDAQFDVVISVFCLESACATHEEYDRCLSRIITLVKPGGYLILGSVIDDYVYNSGFTNVGASKFFSLLNLDVEFIEEKLGAHGMNVPALHKYCLDNDGVAFFLVPKLEPTE